MYTVNWAAFCTCLAWIQSSHAIASTHHHTNINHAPKTHNDFNAIDIPKYGFNFIPCQTFFDSSTHQSSSLFITPPTSITSANVRSHIALRSLYAVQYDINIHKTLQPGDMRNPVSMNEDIKTSDAIYRFKMSLAQVPLRNASLCKHRLQITRKIYQTCIKHAKSQVNMRMRTFACLLSNHCPNPSYSAECGLSIDNSG
eukprot:188081_1